MKTFKQFLKEAKEKKTINEEKKINYIVSSNVMKSLKVYKKKYNKALEALKNA